MVHSRLATGRWKRVHPGVFVLVGAPRSWRQDVAAACLAAGSGSPASFRAAGVLWQQFEAARVPIEITVLRGRRVRLRGVIVHETSCLLPADLATVEGIPVTSPTRTLIDLAGVLPKDELEETLDDVLRRRLTSVSRLRWRMGHAGRSRGLATLRRLLEARGASAPVTGSVLETRFSRLVRRAGLPALDRQHDIRDHGRLVAVVDFAYPAQRIAIEIDGYRWHSGRARWERDLIRRNAITALGWRVLHITSTDIKRYPERVVSTIEAALREVARSPGKHPSPSV